MLKQINRFLIGIITPILLLIATLDIWFSGSSALFLSNEISDVWISLGRLSGDIAVNAILIMIILIARIPWIEQLFGHNQMNKVHRITGYTLSIVLISHPLLLAAGYTKTGNIFQQLFIFVTSWPDVFKAFLSLVLFGIIIISSIPHIRRRLAYESWHSTHLLIYLAIFLSFSHQLNSGNFSGHTGAIIYWYGLYFCVFGLLLWHRIIKPFFLAYKHDFRVNKIEIETADILSVYISGKNLKKYHYLSGQYANLYFLKKGLWSPHPFSFSTAPNNKLLRFSIKRLGDFSSQIEKITVGTKVIIDGPLGVFTERASKRNKFLLLAGGIGVAPIRALIESLILHKKDVKLIYGNQTKNTIAFKKELDNIPHEHYYILSNEKDINPPYQSGRIDIEKIKKFVPDFMERDIYICGPKQMILGLKKQLITNKFPKPNLHYELFEI